MVRLHTPTHKTNFMSICLTTDINKYDRNEVNEPRTIWDMSLKHKNDITNTCADIVILIILCYK